MCVQCVLCHNCDPLLLLHVQVATEQLLSSASCYSGKPSLLSIMYIASTLATKVLVHTSMVSIEVAVEAVLPPRVSLLLIHLHVYSIVLPPSPHTYTWNTTCV